MERIAKFALDRVGEGYIYGAKGQTCSPAFRQQQAEQYPEQARMILEVGKKWDGRKVWDCAQLTRYAAKAAGLTLPSGATSQWEKADWLRVGTIDSLPAGEEAFLYRQSGSRMQHTGVAIGDGTCVHAKGTEAGVVHQPVSDYPWTHWAQLPPAAKEEEPVSMAKRLVVASQNGKPVKVRADASTELPYIGKLEPGTAVDQLGEVVQAGIRWVQIRVGDIAGFVKGEFLVGENAETHAPAETVTVEIERGAAQQLMDALHRALGE